MDNARLNARPLLAAAALALAPALPAMAQADGYLPTAQDIVEMGRRYGFANESAPDADGFRYVDGETNGGLFYGVQLYGCSTDPLCDSVEFFATFTGVDDEGDYQLVNEWNLTNRYGTAYRTEDGTVGVFMSVNLDFGVTRMNLEDTFDIWTIVLEDFADFVYVDTPSGTTPPAK